MDGVETNQQFLQMFTRGEAEHLLPLRGVEERTFDSKDLVILSIITQPTRRHWKICISNKSPKSPRSFISEREEEADTEMLKHQEERRKKRNFIIQNHNKFEENHRTQELDASKLWIIQHNTIYIFHWKAKDPTSSDEKKEDQELYNELFNKAIEGTQDLREVFTHTRYLHLHQQETHNHKNRNIRNTTRKEPYWCTTLQR